MKRAILVITLAGLAFLGAVQVPAGAGEEREHRSDVGLIGTIERTGAGVLGSLRDVLPESAGAAALGLTAVLLVGAGLRATRRRRAEDDRPSRNDRDPLPA